MGAQELRKDSLCYKSFYETHNEKDPSYPAYRKAFNAGVDACIKRLGNQYVFLAEGMKKDKG